MSVVFEVLNLHADAFMCWKFKLDKSKTLEISH